MSVKRLVTVILGMLWESATCLAQLDTAAIIGTVSDSSGAMVASAKVEVQNMGTRTVTT